MAIINKRIGKNWRENNRGFTILEVAVSLFVISMGILGVMTLVNRSIKIKEINKNKFIASQLAQEGIEIVRSTRDNNWLDNDNWNDGIIQDNNYTVNHGKGSKNFNNAPDDLDASSTKLYLDNDGYYRHFKNPGSATSTIFKRIIKVASPSKASTSIKSVVQWKEHGNTHKYTAETVLYNWRYPD